MPCNQTCNSSCTWIIILAFIIIWSFQLTVPMVRLRKIVEKTDIENLAESGRIQGVVSGPDDPCACVFFLIIPGYIYIAL